MAVTLTIPNEFFFERGKGTIDFSSHTFKLVVMASGFTFARDTHGTYADVSASEITTAGGYGIGGYTLTVGAAWAQDDVNDKAVITWVDKVITASGAAFDTFNGAVIIDGSHASKVIIGHVALGADIDVADGASFTFKNLSFEDSQAA